MITISLTREEIGTLKSHEKQALATLIEWNMNAESRKISENSRSKARATDMIAEMEDVPF